MKKTIVLYPSAGIGHLVSMVELGKTFLQHNFNFSITILIPPDPLNPTSSSSTTLPYIKSVSSSFPSISFLHLPPISLPSNILSSSSSSRPAPLAFIFSHLSNPNVLTSLLCLSSQSTKILALIFDFFCYPVLQLTSQLHIHSFCFCTSSASSLAVLLHLPTLQRNHLPHQTQLHFPGNPPIPISDMPFPIFDLSDSAYREFLACGEALRRAKGIMVNSFDSLERRAVEVLRGGACVPDGATPPIYCVGPLVAEEKGGGGAECLAWLDSQPPRSVVFLCFGSLGRFSAAQLREMAAGLERSGQRFLWVLRSPPSEDTSRGDLPEPELGALLPEGFLERTEGRGMVVKSWAPQAAVLSHDSVGGFVTHCGWNSVLEAVVSGVPMVAWPLYAEQRMNKPVLVEELKLAMAVEEEERGWVTAEEVERRVRGLMESEEGEALKKRMAEMKERAVAAMKDGGSSKTELTQLAEMWMRG